MRHKITKEKEKKKATFENGASFKPYSMEYAEN